MTSPVFLFISELARPPVNSTPKLICLLPTVVVMPLKFSSIELTNDAVPLPVIVLDDDSNDNTLDLRLTPS